jgi:hypothetical protein
VAEGGGLLNRYTGNTVSEVRILSSPPFAVTKRNQVTCPKEYFMTQSKNRIVLLVTGLVLIAGAAYLYQNLGGMITRTAEKIASDALGVSVHISGIDVSLSDKKVTVNRIKIGNPPGYSKPYIMTADGIDITLKSADTKLIDFKDITVRGSVVNMEINETGMNLLTLKNMANRKEQKDQAGSESVRVIVQRMVIDSSKVNTSITLLKRDVPSLQLPPVTVSGTGNQSMPAGDAVVRVISSYFTAVEKHVRQTGALQGVPGMNDVTKTLDNVTDRLKNLF